MEMSTVRAFHGSGLMLSASNIPPMGGSTEVKVVITPGKHLSHGLNGRAARP